MLLGGNGRAELDEFIDRTLGPLLVYDRERNTRLVETWRRGCWRRRGARDRGSAALHANTVTQRLDRVTQLLGPGWREARRRLDIHLALQLARLREDM